MPAHGFAALAPQLYDRKIGDVERAALLILAAEVVKISRAEDRGGTVSQALSTKATELFIPGVLRRLASFTALCGGDGYSLYSLEAHTSLLEVLLSGTAGVSAVVSAQG